MGPKKSKQRIYNIVCVCLTFSVAMMPWLHSKQQVSCLLLAYLLLNLENKSLVM
jgi:hypothetical protein